MQLEVDPSGMIRDVCDDGDCGGCGDDPCFSFDPHSSSIILIDAALRYK